MTWQDIADAPKDGTAILATGTYDIDGQAPGGGGLAGERWYAVVMWSITWGQDPAWVYVRDGGRLYNMTVTHWADLTAPSP